MKPEQRMQSIRMILSDVDGVLTDGGLLYDNQGVESKKFHVRDGLGIKLWMSVGYHFGLLTARTSHIVRVRAAELGITIVRQGFEQKLPMALQVMEEYKLKPEEVCYIGDDLPDIPVMKHVGLAVSVADGANEARSIAHLVTDRPGGAGAVRELIERILESQKRWSELKGRYMT